MGALDALDADGAPVNPRIVLNAGTRVWIPSKNGWYGAAHHSNPDSSGSGYFK